ncbi:hypothetical protein [Fimbriimonas ginsengisoli]|uniref:Uncharacterized protein n=1 Tax=Fimbriimonas ginsengisoli Gsoil 348 TaxID=661478 RepID=A0A068NSJ8_FIMGI|nr:hypothetical protein [Fimbriimonas ginsengisoli]AIE86513.1 hypothetical protein OP10G_3145 [Fimbriimonas ginsengisoli Gsoil 348]
MSRSIIKFGILATIVGALYGCGGSSGQTASVDYSAFAGTYSAAYTRSTGAMTIAVATNGLITITIVDSIQGTFVGTGIANHVGGFFITANGANNKQVTVNGTLKGTGLGRTAQGTIAGSISVPYNAPFLNSPDVTVYANHYEGGYKQGAAGNDWSGDVAANGSFTGTLLIDGGASTVDLTGNVYSNGSFKFTGSGGGTSYTAQGNFALSTNQSVVTNGTLVGVKNGTKVTGDWFGHNAIGG